MWVPEGCSRLKASARELASFRKLVLPQAKLFCFLLFSGNVASCVAPGSFFDNRISSPSALTPGLCPPGRRWTPRQEKEIKRDKSQLASFPIRVQGALR
jgi:hypothetical protein